MQKKRNFWILLCGMTVSEVGTYIYDFAVSWVILQKTSSALMMTTYLALGMIGRIVFGPVISVYMEKVNKKKAVIILDFIFAFLIFFLALIEPSLQITGFKIVFFVVSFFMSCLSSAYAPCFSCLLKEGVPENYLHKVNAVRSIVNNCDSLGGMVLGGVLIGILPFHIVLAVNAASFFFSAISEIFISYEFKPQKKVSEIKFMADILEGIRSFWYNISIRNTVWNVTFYNFLNYGLYMVALEYFFNQVLKTTAIEYSAVNVVMMGSTIVASMVIAAKHHFNIEKNFKLGLLSSVVCSLVLISTVLVCLLARVQTNIIILLCGMILLLSGITDSILDVSFETYIQKKVGEDVYVRNVAIIYTLLEVLSPVSALVSGVILELVDMKIFLCLFFIGYLVFGIGLVRNRKIG